MDEGVFIFLALLMAFAAFAVMTYLSRQEAKKAVRSFGALLSVSGLNVELDEEIPLERGTLEVRGEWRSSGKSSHYYISRHFEVEETLRARRIEGRPLPFFVLRNGDTIYLRLPAYRVASGELSGVLLIPIVPSYRFEVEESVEVSRDMEFAQLRLEPLENGFAGRLYVNVERCRGVKAFLKGRGDGVLVKKELVNSAESTQFTHEFFSRPLLVLSHYSIVDPRKIAALFGSYELIAGHGEFEVELVLDVPLSPDVSSSSTLKVDVGEEAKGAFEVARAV